MTYITHQHYKLLLKKVESIGSILKDLSDEIYLLRYPATTAAPVIKANTEGKTPLACAISELMAANGIKSVAKLARIAKVPQPTMHRIMAGEVKSPSLNTLSKISKALNTNLVHLMGIENERTT
jgi:DNA-binding Xre family transcriptional regulator